MKVQHEILINAQQTKVWETSTQLEHWHLWTPTVEKAELLSECFQMGSRALIKQPGQRQATWEVTHFHEGHAFTWQSTHSGLTMIATHQLTAIHDSQTRNLLELEVRGLLAFLLYPVIKYQAQKALIAENEGLKAYCEKA